VQNFGHVNDMLALKTIRHCVLCSGASYEENGLAQYERALMFASSAPHSTVTRPPHACVPQLAAAIC